MKFQMHIMASYMLNLDCKRIFKEIALEWRGGDKSNFVMGVIRRENVGEFTSTIVRKLTTK